MTCLSLNLFLATVALALYVLQQEKQLSYNNYRYSFRKTSDQISATLRHPAGQLALLNPANDKTGTLHPIVLPYSSLDFDDQTKVQQAIAMAGCLVQYGDNGSLCVAIGNNPWAGGFIYVTGNVLSTELVAHEHGNLDLNQAHRVRVTVALRGTRPKTAISPTSWWGPRTAISTGPAAVSMATASVPSTIRKAQSPTSP